ncbi:gamma-glutamyltransferase family protein [Bosea psychrotolerans]|uniref:Gamma-glutamyltransferase 1 n=1 Tax=Bosea psychrotolerans TaxID=1871628 RepID=A0A2S4M9N6_9HYPH|nr:gamma-glutamyltransferase [Bosea psychrotolerans]POR51456.1 gamma-glutamyltransferase 1 [Bosea psychrotolerans]
MQTFTVQRPAVQSPHGLVAAQNRHAAEAGAAVLSRGGNAMDAAIVTALVLSTVEPWLSGVGGGGFLVHADGRTGATETLDFNVRAAAGLDPADYPLTDGQSGNWFAWPAVIEERNVSGYSAICVPGAIAGFAAALARHGTLSWEEALQPAIEHAERGLEIDWFAALCIAIDAAGLSRDPAAAALLLDDGHPPKAGADTRRFKPMARKAALLRRLAKAGARDFYEGESARMIAADLEAGGSPIRISDLTAYEVAWAPALAGHYRDFDIAALPGLSGGPTLLDAASKLEGGPLSRETTPAQTALLYASAIREAYATRLTTLGHAATPQAGCTSHVSVVDRDGTMVSLTNTLLSRFGAKVALPHAGIFMNNGMMWFDPRPGQPNSIAAGQKPLANMCPLVLSRNGRPVLAIGAAGGRTIFPTVLQLISGLADFGLSLEETFHRPRIDASTPCIKIDARAQADVAATVATAFPVEIVEDTLYPVNFSIPSAVMAAPAGGFIGMAHPTSPWAAVVAATA